MFLSIENFKMPRKVGNGQQPKEKYTKVTAIIKVML